MKFSILVMLILSFTPFNSSKRPEQVCLEHFIKENLSSYDFKIGFSGKTQSVHSRFGSSRMCLDQNFYLKSDIENMADSLDNSGSSSKMKLNAKSHFKRRGKNQIRVYKSTKVADMDYVTIELGLGNEAAHFFFYEINKDLVVLRSCEVRVIY